MTSILKVKELSKQYQARAVLNMDALTFARGEITALMGPSGSGKSTFLKIVNGIETPTTGAVHYDGFDVTSGKTIPMDVRRSMVLVFQKPVLFNGSVFHNIAYGLKIRGMNPGDIQQKVTNILSLIGLDEKAKQHARTLSGGEAQRVALARALVTEPKLLLLDEPTSNLDPANVAMIESLIRHAKEKLHTSVVLVTHNMHQARRLADHVVFLSEGAVIEAGCSNQVFKSPENPLTKAFINGDMIC